MNLRGRYHLHRCSLLFCCLFGHYVASSAGVVSAECSGAVANFDVSSGTVCLPSVDVTDNSGKSTYQANISLLTGSSVLRFAVTSASSIAATSNAAASFSLLDGRLQVPAVEIRNGYGVERYKAVLSWDAGSNAPITFSLSSVDAIISPDYAPGITWKPYVGLLSNEKQAVNTLERSLPYAALANAVYDFGNTMVGDWHLVDSVSNSSGMQAAVYLNNSTQEMALAYRGTETCSGLSCFGSAGLEAGKDTLTDSLLTQGKDSGQFDDAYNYARDMLNKYPGKIKTITGHSLGGGLAQAVGAAATVETFVFNSSPVANNYFDQHGVKAKDPNYANFIHVLADVHDPVSNTDEKGNIYADAAHVAPLLQFDFDKKEVLPTYKVTLDSLRFNKHSIVTLINNITLLTNVYQGGW